MMQPGIVPHEFLKCLSIPVPADVSFPPYDKENFLLRRKIQKVNPLFGSEIKVAWVSHEDSTRFDYVAPQPRHWANLQRLMRTRSFDLNRVKGLLLWISTLFTWFSGRK